MTFALGQETNIANFRAMKTRIEREIRNHRSWYMFQGGAFLLFGILSVILPGLTAFSAALFFGAILVFTGILQLFSSMRSRMHWWSLLSAMLSIVIGGWMLLMPLEGVLALAVVIGFFLAVEGALEILLALEFHPARNWAWMLLSGIAALILSALLWSGWPVLSIFYLGILIGVNFIFYGISLLMLAAYV